MNKQAITFFSLFSLILVLSVYYILIPPTQTEEDIVTNQVSALQDKLDSKRDGLLQTQNDILASSTSTGEELNQALEAMNDTQKSVSTEAKVKQKIISLGYKDVFCEIDDDIIKVTITKNDGNTQDVLKVMECIEEICENKYSPEIKFISE